MVNEVAKLLYHYVTSVLSAQPLTPPPLPILLAFLLLSSLTILCFKILPSVLYHIFLEMPELLQLPGQDNKLAFYNP